MVDAATESWRKEFDTLDRRESGKITAIQFKQICARFGVVPDFTELNEVAQANTVTLARFMEYAKKQRRDPRANPSAPRIGAIARRERSSEDPDAENTANKSASTRSSRTTVTARAASTPMSPLHQSKKDTPKQDPTTPKVVHPAVRRSSTSSLWSHTAMTRTASHLPSRLSKPSPQNVRAKSSGQFTPSPPSPRPPVVDDLILIQSLPFLDELDDSSAITRSESSARPWNHRATAILIDDITDVGSMSETELSGTGEYQETAFDPCADLLEHNHKQRMTEIREKALERLGEEVSRLAADFSFKRPPSDQTGR